MVKSPDVNYNVTVYLKEPIRDGFPRDTYHVNHLTKDIVNVADGMIIVRDTDGDSYFYERSNLVGFSCEIVVPNESND